MLRQKSQQVLTSSSSSLAVSTAATASSLIVASCSSSSASAGVGGGRGRGQPPQSSTFSSRNPKINPTTKFPPPQKKRTPSSSSAPATTNNNNNNKQQKESVSSPSSSNTQSPNWGALFDTVVTNIGTQQQQQQHPTKSSLKMTPPAVEKQTLSSEKDQADDFFIDENETTTAEEEETKAAPSVTGNEEIKLQQKEEVEEQQTKVKEQQQEQDTSWRPLNKPKFARMLSNLIISSGPTVSQSKYLKSCKAYEDEIKQAEREAYHQNKNTSDDDPSSSSSSTDIHNSKNNNNHDDEGNELVSSIEKHQPDIDDNPSDDNVVADGSVLIKNKNKNKNNDNNNENVLLSSVTKYKTVAEILNQFYDLANDSGRERQLIAVTGETGVGKSCTVPLLMAALYEGTTTSSSQQEQEGEYNTNNTNDKNDNTSINNKKKRNIVWVTQPTRAACIGLTRWMSSLIEGEIGREIGYATGEGTNFDIEKTQIVICTPGYAAKYLSSVRTSLGAHTIIIDEAHAVDEHLETLLAVSSLYIKDAAFVFMSATMDFALLRRLFNVSQRTHAVSLHIHGKDHYNRLVLNSNNMLGFFTSRTAAVAAGDEDAISTNNNNNNNNSTGYVDPQSQYKNKSARTIADTQRANKRKRKPFVDKFSQKAAADLLLQISPSVMKNQLIPALKNHRNQYGQFDRGQMYFSTKFTTALAHFAVELARTSAASLTTSNEHELIQDHHHRRHSAIVSPQSDPNHFFHHIPQTESDPTSVLVFLPGFREIASVATSLFRQYRATSSYDQDGRGDMLYMSRFHIVVYGIEQSSNYTNNNNNNNTSDDNNNRDVGELVEVILAHSSVVGNSSSNVQVGFDMATEYGDRAWFESPQQLMIQKRKEEEREEQRRQAAAALAKTKKSSSGTTEQHEEVKNDIRNEKKNKQQQQQHYYSPSSSSQVPVFRGRTIVLATNVAESSVTIPNLKYVVDLGLERFEQCSPNQSGSSYLSTRWISETSARQRAGRVGRIGNGVVFRLYHESVLRKSHFLRFAPPSMEEEKNSDRKNDEKGGGGAAADLLLDKDIQQQQNINSNISPTSGLALRLEQSRRMNEKEDLILLERLLLSALACPTLPKNHSLEEIASCWVSFGAPPSASASVSNRNLVNVLMSEYNRSALDATSRRLLQNGLARKDPNFKAGIRLTRAGLFIAQLPLPLQYSRFVWNSMLFGSLVDSIIICAILPHSQEFFMAIKTVYLAHQRKQYEEEQARTPRGGRNLLRKPPSNISDLSTHVTDPFKNAYFTRLEAGIEQHLSEPWMIRQILVHWLSMPRRAMRKRQQSAAAARISTATGERIHMGNTSAPFPNSRDHSPSSFSCGNAAGSGGEGGKAGEPGGFSTGFLKPQGAFCEYNAILGRVLSDIDSTIVRITSSLEMTMSTWNGPRSSSSSTSSTHNDWADELSQIRALSILVRTGCVFADKQQEATEALFGKMLPRYVREEETLTISKLIEMELKDNNNNNNDDGAKTSSSSSSSSSSSKTTSRKDQTELIDFMERKRGFEKNVHDMLGIKNVSSSSSSSTAEDEESLSSWKMVDELRRRRLLMAFAASFGEKVIVAVPSDGKYKGQFADSPFLNPSSLPSSSLLSPDGSSSKTESKSIVKVNGIQKDVVVIKSTSPQLQLAHTLLDNYRAAETRVEKDDNNSNVNNYGSSVVDVWTDAAAAADGGSNNHNNNNDIDTSSSSSSPTTDAIEEEFQKSRTSATRDRDIINVLLKKIQNGNNNNSTRGATNNNNSSTSSPTTTSSATTTKTQTLLHGGYYLPPEVIKNKFISKFIGAPNSYGHNLHHGSLPTVYPEFHSKAQNLLRPDFQVDVRDTTSFVEITSADLTLENNNNNNKQKNSPSNSSSSSSPTFLPTMMMMPKPSAIDFASLEAIRVLTHVQIDASDIYIPVSDFEKRTTTTRNIDDDSKGVEEEPAKSTTEASTTTVNNNKETEQQEKVVAAPAIITLESIDQTEYFVLYLYPPRMFPTHKSNKQNQQQQDSSSSSSPASIIFDEQGGKWIAFNRKTLDTLGLTEEMTAISRISDLMKIATTTPTTKTSTSSSPSSEKSMDIKNKNDVDAKDDDNDEDGDITSKLKRKGEGIIRLVNEDEEDDHHQQQDSKDRKSNNVDDDEETAAARIQQQRKQNEKQLQEDIDIDKLFQENQDKLINLRPLPTQSHILHSPAVFILGSYRMDINNNNNNNTNNEENKTDSNNRNGGLSEGKSDQKQQEKMTSSEDTITTSNIPTATTAAAANSKEELKKRMAEIIKNNRNNRHLPQKVRLEKALSILGTGLQRVSQETMMSLPTSDDNNGNSGDTTTSNENSTNGTTSEQNQSSANNNSIENSTNNNKAKQLLLSTDNRNIDELVDELFENIRPDHHNDLETVLFAGESTLDLVKTLDANNNNKKGYHNNNRRGGHSSFSYSSAASYAIDNNRMRQTVNPETFFETDGGFRIPRHLRPHCALCRKQLTHHHEIATHRYSSEHLKRLCSLVKEELSLDDTNMSYSAENVRNMLQLRTNNNNNNKDDENSLAIMNPKPEDELLRSFSIGGTFGPHSHFRALKVYNPDESSASSSSSSLVNSNNNANSSSSSPATEHLSNRDIFNRSNGWGGQSVLLGFASHITLPPPIASFSRNAVITNSWFVVGGLSQSSSSLNNNNKKLSSTAIIDDLLASVSIAGSSNGMNLRVLIELEVIENNKNDDVIRFKNNNTKTNSDDGDDICKNNNNSDFNSCRLVAIQAGPLPPVAFSNHTSPIESIRQLTTLTLMKNNSNNTTSEEDQNNNNNNPALESFLHILKLSRSSFQEIDSAEKTRKFRRLCFGFMNHKNSKRNNDDNNEVSKKTNKNNTRDSMIVINKERVWVSFDDLYKCFFEEESSSSSVSSTTSTTMPSPPSSLLLPLQTLSSEPSIVEAQFLNSLLFSLTADIFDGRIMIEKIVSRFVSQHQYRIVVDVDQEKDNSTNDQEEEIDEDNDDSILKTEDQDLSSHHHVPQAARSSKKIRLNRKQALNDLANLCRKKGYSSLHEMLVLSCGAVPIDPQIGMLEPSMTVRKGRRELFNNSSSNNGRNSWKETKTSGALLMSKSMLPSRVVNKEEIVRTL